MRKFIAIAILIFWPLNLLLNGDMRNFSATALTETVFLQDYQAEQRILNKINLYPSVFFARVYQNKARIYLDKVNSNIFALTDVNNYFFGFHPRQIVGNQNLKKFPFASIVFFVAGIYLFRTFKRKKFLLIYTATAFTYLSILKNFDRVDILLWLPISFITLHGLDKVSQNKKYWRIVVPIFWIFTIPQIIRIFSGYQ